MFERFTRGARATVAQAQRLAREAASSEVTTPHLALALLDQEATIVQAVSDAGGTPAEITRQLLALVHGGGLDRDALASVGIDLDEVSAHADQAFGRGALLRDHRRGGEPGWGRDAKKSLELALREAIRLGERTIEQRHLMLGMLRADCPARTVLVDDGVDLIALRERLEAPDRATA